jgi:hypothetical protein
MKVIFKRSGGIMGARDSVELDTESMSEKEAGEIYTAFEKTKFLRKSSEKSPVIDNFHYRISIEKVLEVDDLTSTAKEIKPLIDLLMSKVPPRKR